MPKPILMTIDDDPQVLRAIERDLRQKYGKDYRVMHAESGEAALATLEQLKLRNDAVAIFICDQRMPHMSGVEFLEQARKLFPDAKRVLLTAYADTEAAIKAINTVRIDYYFMKPWNPPEEQLYPILNDLLEDWRADFRPGFEGVRVIGHRWSPQTHQVKDFLARNQVPYQSLDIERDEAARQLLKHAGAEASQLPFVLLPDGSSLAQPTNIQLAEKVGLQTRAEKPFYELVIVGGGPAGLAAAVYGASEGLSTVMIEREAPGGQAGTSSRIENYLGFPTGLGGGDLARRGLTQARRFGVEVLTPQEACNVRLQDSYRILTLADNSEISCHALLIATGVSYRMLDVPGVERLAGAGVYYGAAMSEAFSCVDEDVYIVGGANSAGQAAMYFSKFARTVVLVVRGDSLEKGMSQYLVNQIHATDNIRVALNTNVIEAQGEANLERLVLANSAENTTETVPASGLFIFIGAQPRTDWLEGVVARDNNGFILAGQDVLIGGKRPKEWTADRDPFLLETSVPGIFVAGDVRAGSVKRVASGVGEGSIAVQFVHRYLSTL